MDEQLSFSVLESIDHITDQKEDETYFLDTGYKRAKLTELVNLDPNRDQELIQMQDLNNDDDNIMVINNRFVNPNVGDHIDLYWPQNSIVLEL